MRRKSRTQRQETRKRAGSKRRKRAKITDATRAELKKLVDAGKSGREIANPDEARAMMGLAS